MKGNANDSCRSIMSNPPAVLKPTDTLRFALQAMVDHRVPTLPVVDGSGRYLGMLPRSRLIQLVMPRVLQQEDVQHPLSRLQAGFIREPLDSLQQRFAAVADEPVGRHVDAEVPLLSPNSPLMTAMLHLHRQRNVLPVIENGRLIGIVSVYDALRCIGRAA